MSINRLCGLQRNSFHPWQRQRHLNPRLQLRNPAIESMYWYQLVVGYLNHLAWLTDAVALYLCSQAIHSDQERGHTHQPFSCWFSSFFRDWCSCWSQHLVVPSIAGSRDQLYPSLSHAQPAYHYFSFQEGALYSTACQLACPCSIDSWLSIKAFDSPAQDCWRMVDSFR